MLFRSDCTPSISTLYYDSKRRQSCRPWLDGLCKHCGINGWRCNPSSHRVRVKGNSESAIDREFLAAGNWLTKYRLQLRSESNPSKVLVQKMPAEGDANHYLFRVSMYLATSSRISSDRWFCGGMVGKSGRFFSGAAMYCAMALASSPYCALIAMTGGPIMRTL